MPKSYKHHSQTFQYLIAQPGLLLTAVGICCVLLGYLSNKSLSLLQQLIGCLDQELCAVLQAQHV